MVEMRDVFEAVEEGVVGDVIGWIKGKLRGKKRKAVSKQLGPDKWEFKGKKGHWRNVHGHDVFFPDDHSEPMGMPKAMKKAKKKDTSPEGLRRELIAAKKAGKLPTGRKG